MTHTTKTYSDRLLDSVGELIIDAKRAETFLQSDDYDAQDVITHLREAQVSLQDARLYFVLDQRKRGQSWAAIGDMLGMTRQAVWEKYGDLTDD